MSRRSNRALEDKRLTTQQLPEIYGYGPAYVQPRGKGGRVFYWQSVILAWLGVPQNDSEGPDDE